MYSCRTSHFPDNITCYVKIQFSLYKYNSACTDLEDLQIFKICKVVYWLHSLRGNVVFLQSFKYSSAPSSSSLTPLGPLIHSPTHPHASSPPNSPPCHSPAPFPYLGWECLPHPCIFFLLLLWEISKCRSACSLTVCQPGDNLWQMVTPAVCLNECDEYIAFSHYLRYCRSLRNNYFLV